MVTRLVLPLVLAGLGPAAVPAQQADDPSGAPASAEPSGALTSDITLAEEEAFLDVAATPDALWDLLRSALGERRPPLPEETLTESWVVVGDLWLRVEPLAYKPGITRVRIRVGDFTTDEERGLAREILVALATLVQLREGAVEEPEPPLDDAVGRDAQWSQGEIQGESWSAGTAAGAGRFWPATLATYTWVPLYGFGFTSWCDVFFVHHGSWWAYSGGYGAWHAYHHGYPYGYGYGSLAYGWPYGPYGGWYGGHHSYYDCHCAWCAPVVIVDVDDHHHHDDDDASGGGDGGSGGGGPGGDGPDDDGPLVDLAPLNPRLAQDDVGVGRRTGDDRPGSTRPGRLILPGDAGTRLRTIELPPIRVATRVGGVVTSGFGRRTSGDPDGSTPAGDPPLFGGGPGSGVAGAGSGDGSTSSGGSGGVSGGFGGGGFGGSGGGSGDTPTAGPTLSPRVVIVPRGATSFDRGGDLGRRTAPVPSAPRVYPVTPSLRRPGSIGSRGSLPTPSWTPSRGLGSPRTPAGASAGSRAGGLGSVRSTGPSGGLRASGGRASGPKPPAGALSPSPGGRSFGGKASSGGRSSFGGKSSGSASSGGVRKATKSSSSRAGPRRGRRG